ncbi:MAG: glycosyltransferase [Chromatiales bacterium]|nr:glycosyltransferase [Chromatiales bacterium]
MNSALGQRPHLSFRDRLEAEFRNYLSAAARTFPEDQCLRLDLHCHDRNSDVPDELWGRILGLPETWLKTKDLVRCLRDNGSDVITVTNHNNARSCWELLDRGEDVLVGAEFTCLFPEYSLYVHVLTYGFTPEQEVILNRKRSDIYEFVRYAAEQDIPLVLPHPLYFYTSNEHINLGLFEKLSLMFQRFEVLNGQRDIWQSVLTLNWTQILDEETLTGYSMRHGLEPADFGVDITRPKILTGGSDDHMGLTAGQCGSWLYVENLRARLKSESASSLALQAIRDGHIAPYGKVGENQRLGVALLDYFVQIAARMEDPGLLRMVLHRGETRDKLYCLAIGNAMLELKKHKKTKKFVDFVHDALHGKKPGRLVKWNVSKDYKFCVDQLTRIADARRNTPDRFDDIVNSAIAELFTGLSQLAIGRFRKSLANSESFSAADLTTESLTRRFEIPSQLTLLAYGDKSHQKNMSGLNIGKLFDALSFPILIMAVLAGSQVASTHALYKNRRFLNEFACHLGRNQHQRRALYLTDTLRDRNGVSHSLSGKLAEIQRKDLPIDFLICHAQAEPEAHLHVVRPLAEFSIPSFGEQPIRIPDLLEIARIFYAGGYDRVVCSTEGPLAVVAMILKFMFNVPGYFFMHTDWLDFLCHTTKLNGHELDRVRRLLRAMYLRFDGIFVLNSEHREWLTGQQMGLPEDAVFGTAHHIEDLPERLDSRCKSSLVAGLDDDAPVLLTACRLSREKGILDLPEIYRRVRETLPNLQWVIAGAGPHEDELREAFPQAHYLGWLGRDALAELYAGLDLFVFPSRFDTFGNVVLEAFSQGMPVVAFDRKGPADIVEHERSGYLVDSVPAMADRIARHFEQTPRHAAMREAARRRVLDYQAEPIMRQFLNDLGLPYDSPKPVAA